MPKSTEKFVNQAGLAHYTGIIKNHTDLSLQVDDVTIEFTESMNDSGSKLRVKDEGITEDKLSLSLRLTLGIVNIASLNAQQIAEILSTANLEQQQNVVADITASMISTWSVDDLIQVVSSMDSSLRASFVSQKVNLAYIDWSDIYSLAGTIIDSGAGSALVGKTKQLQLAGYGTYEARVIGISHNDLQTGGKARTTWQFTSTIQGIKTKWYESYDLETFNWANSVVRGVLNGTVYNAFESGLKSQIKEIALPVTTKFDRTATTYGTSNDKVFILSMDEGDIPNGAYADDFQFRAHEGTIFQWYSQGGSHPYDMSWSSGGFAYTITRTITDYREIGMISSNGGTESVSAEKDARVVPAFCI